VHACFLLAAWPAYLVLAPLAWEYHWAVGLGIAIFPGVYLWTWMAVMYHETWHNYLPGVPNRLFFELFGCMLPADPQVFDLVHCHHHTDVHTYRDAEFYPYGEIRRPILRKIYLLLEFTLGMFFLGIMLHRVVRVNPRYRPRFSHSWRVAATLKAVVLYGGCVALTHWVLDVPGPMIALAYAVPTIAGSSLVHQSRLVQHGYIIVDADWADSNLWSGNIRNHGVLERLLAFMTHNDPVEHVLHHTVANVNTRAHIGEIPMPPESRYLSVRESWAWLWRVWKAPELPEIYEGRPPAREAAEEEM